MYVPNKVMHIKIFKINLILFLTSIMTFHNRSTEMG